MSTSGSHQSGLHSAWRRSGKPVSIKKRVIRVVLIPSTALIVLWVIAAIYLSGPALYNQQVGKGVERFAGPAITGLTSIQKERQLSIRYLARPDVDPRQLRSQRAQSDSGMAQAQQASATLLTDAPEPVAGEVRTLSGYLNRLPAFRAKVDARQVGIDEVTTFYDNVVDAATALFGAQSRATPDAAAIPGALAATNLFQVTDRMSRSSSVIAGALATGTLDRADYLDFVDLVGAYRALLETVEPDITPDVRAQYRALTAGKQWRDLSVVEDALIEKGPWSGGAQAAGVPVTGDDWQSLTDAVSANLVRISILQSEQVAKQVLDDGHKQVLQLGIALGIVLLGVIASIWWARRQSSTMVDNALVTRLAKLRSDAQELVHRRLPDMVGRVRKGKTVDPQRDLPVLHYGVSDEIGQVADSISTALRQAVTAAAGEAQARNALNTLFRGIARRNQLPLYNLLNLLDKLEQAEQDSTALQRLYRLDHEATRARRNSENLIILSGGDIGQHLPGPVRMREVLRSAISETHEYQRVKITGVVPDLAVASDAATGLIHLLAELLENAARFSPPSDEVRLSALPAQAGLLIEVEDHGLGIPAERLDRLNTMLAAPPELDAMAIGDGSQLGMWVIASLVQRYGFAVSLRPAEHGGTIAAVGVPRRLVSADEGETAEQAAAARVNGGIARLFAHQRQLEDAEPSVPSQAGADTPRGTGRQFQPPLPRRPTSAPGQRPAQPLPPSTQPPKPPAQAAPAAPAAQSPPRALPRRTPRASGHGTKRTDKATEPAEVPTEVPAERPPLPRRSPGGHLNKRLAETTSQAPSVDDPDSAPWQAGAALGAFQHGSEAGRRAADTPMTPPADTQSSASDTDGTLRT